MQLIASRIWHRCHPAGVRRTCSGELWRVVPFRSASLSSLSLHRTDEVRLHAAIFPAGEGKQAEDASRLAFLLRLGAGLTGVSLLTCFATKSRERGSLLCETGMPLGCEMQIGLDIGLEMQAPWGKLLLWGYKTVETRNYPLPSELLGREIFIFESAEGLAGVSAVGDAVPNAAPGLRIIGSVVFSASIPYANKEDWIADEHRHRVSPSSPYGWSDNKTIYGWEVKLVKPLACPVPVPAMRRIVRSLFVMDLPNDGPHLITLKSRLGTPPPTDRENIPLIDLTGFLAGSAEQQQKVVDAVAAQCEYIGFLRVTWDGFPRNTIEEAHRAARTMFQCTEEQKRNWSKSAILKQTRSYTSTGYRGYGSTENNKNRESWSCTVPRYHPGAPNFSSDYYTCETGQQHFALPPDPQVPWPDEARVAGFRNAVCEYYDEVDNLGKVLLCIFARILGCEESKLLAMADRHVSPINLFSFTMGEGGEVLPAHADVSAFTILTHDVSTGAAGSASLEMLTPDGVWEKVETTPGTFLVNLGQIMQRWSNGRLRATVHRVVPPVASTEQKGAKRQTITFFQLLNYDASVSVLSECCSEGAKYEAMDLPDWQNKRLAGFYEPAALRDINKCWYNYNLDSYVV